MISRCFIDLDNTLICEHPYFYKENSFDFAFGLDDEIFYIKINNSSYPVLNFARNLVGEENVWMLTTATRDYAIQINKSARFGFPESQIVARDELRKVVDSVRFDPDFKNPYKDKNNVLIDNLSPRHNEDKMIFLGIDIDNYLKIDEYNGVASEFFEEEVIEFLIEKYNETD